MTYTVLPIKTNGVSNITAAEMNTYLRDNIAHLRARNTWKSSAGVDTSASGTEQDIDFIGVIDDWDTNAVKGVTLNYADVYDSDPGIWYVGATGRWEANTTNDRRLRLYEAHGGTVGAVISDYRAQAPNRPCRLTACTSFNFTSTDSEFRPRVLQDSGSSLDTRGDFWGMHVGSATSTTAAFGDSALSDSQGVTAWWTQLRLNMERIDKRPAFRVHRAGARSIPNNTWTDMLFDTEAHDTCTGIGADESKFVVPTNQGGLYFIHGCVRFDGLTTANTNLAARILVNGSQLTHGIAVGAEVSSADASVPICAVASLDPGDEVTMECLQGSGASVNLDVGATNHMGGFMLAGSSYTVPNRQFFPDGLPDQFSYADPDSAYLPRGLANVMARDYLAHLWNPPVIGVQAGDTVLAPGGFQSVDCGETFINEWGESEMPASTWQAGGGLELPQDGLWLVVASLRIADEGEGSTGNRGMKILHRSFSEGQHRWAGPTVSNADYAQTTSVLIDGKAGDPVKLFGMQHTGDDTEVVSATLTAAWVGDRP